MEKFKSKFKLVIVRAWVTGTILFLWQAAGAQQILVPPYIQPGNASTLSREQKVVIWQTDGTPGEFKVEFATGTSIESSEKPAIAKISSVKLNLNNTTTFLYRATLTGLKFDETYTYRVSLSGKPIAEHTFETRTKKPQTRFAVFGDCGIGSPHQAKIAYQVYQQKPQFALITGDMVYSYGREAEYRARFFPYYLAPVAAPNRGAPLMNSIPFYMLLGNHDIYSADFDKHPDGLAFFYYNDLPLNGAIPASTVKPEGNKELIKAFEKNTSPRFPRIANYSFDYGNVHIACLDANHYVNPLDPSLIEWLANDMRNSKADWKIVAYHHPAFNSSPTHYDYQVMRLLAPVCEELGVDLVLTGHVHNYQRTVPLKFAPKIDATTKQYTISEAGRVDGQFTLDNQFDGISKTRPNGIIYIVSGAGGAALYDRQISEKPELWKTANPENWAPYTTKLVSDIHSFTMIETDGKTLTLKQLDGEGKIFDEIRVTK
jgi:acid phosphatase type 7